MNKLDESIEFLLAASEKFNGLCELLQGGADLTYSEAIASLIGQAEAGVQDLNAAFNLVSDFEASGSDD